MFNVLTFQLSILFCELIFFQILFYNKKIIKFKEDKNSKLCGKKPRRFMQKMEDSNPSYM